MQVLGTRGAQALFLLVFPGFFAYQALSAFAVIPPVLGGGLTLFAAFGLLLAPFVLARAVAQLPALAAIAALCAIVLAYAAYHHFNGADYQRTSEVTLSSVKLVAAWGGLFCIGSLLKPSERFRSVLVWCVIAMAIVTPFLIKTPALSLVDTVRSGWEVASYQFFAGAFAFTAILAIAYSGGREAEPWLVAASLVTIFFLLSRSEQLGLFAVALGWVALKLLKRDARPVLIAIGATAALMAASFLVQPFVPALVSERTALEVEAPQGATSADIIARQTEVLNIAASESWGERSKFLAGGIDDILRSPIAGDYAGQVRDFGFFGAYIHNALSAWSQYGLLAFAIYVLASIAGFAAPAWRVVRDGYREEEWVAATMVGGFCLLLIIATKAVYWPMPALAWGMSASLFNMQRVGAGLRTASARP